MNSILRLQDGKHHGSLYPESLNALARGGRDVKRHVVIPDLYAAKVEIMSWMYVLYKISRYFLRNIPFGPQFSGDQVGLGRFRADDSKPVLLQKDEVIPLQLLVLRRQCTLRHFEDFDRIRESLRKGKVCVVERGQISQADSTQSYMFRM